MKKMLSIFLLIILILGSTACTVQPEIRAADIRNFREVPGVTQEEIRAIEELAGQYTSLSLGMPYSAESFQYDDGTYGGFSALLCQWLTDLFDIPFHLQIIDTDQFSEDVNARRVDLTVEFSPSEERSEKFEVTEGFVAHRMNQIIRLREALPIEEIQRERPVRYAMLEGSTIYDLLLAHVENSFVPVFVQDYAGGLEALRDGKADGMLLDNAMQAWFVGEADVEMQSFYPLIYKPKPLMATKSELSPILRVVDKFLAIPDGEWFLQKMYDQGTDQYLRYAFDYLLSDEERAYIERKKADGGIRVVYDSDNYPISFYNEAEREFQGLAVDVLEEIHDITGIPFTVVDKIASTADIAPTLAGGEADIAGELLYSNERAAQFLWASDPNMTDQFVLVSPADTELSTFGEVAISRVGLIESAMYTQMFLSWFPEHEHVVYYRTHEEAFDALEAGEVDLVMGTVKMLLGYSNYKERPVFQASMVFDTAYESKFAFNKGDEILVSIIDKAHHMVNVDAIANDWNYKAFDYQKKMYEMQIPYLVAVCTLMAGILTLLGIMLVRNRKANKRLELTVQARTKVLQQQKQRLVTQTDELETKTQLLEEKTRELEIQTKAAQAASVAKGDFLARMSHEIRTPLNAIIGMTDIGMAADKIDKKQSCLRQVEAASTQLLGIINDILDMSKIEASKLEIEKRDMDLEQMLINVTNVINFRVEEKHLTFLVNIDKNMPPKIIGDELRLTQIITNLLSNAVKFTPEGGLIQLNVITEHASGDQCRLRFEVCDNGIGISPEDQKKLFRSFEQADGSVARKFGGTGLGLAISKNLVELMGGRIWVESEAGKGSKFIFTLECERGRTSPRPELHPAIDKDRLRVLVADDSREIRTYLVNLMQTVGIPCDAASDGFEALELFVEAHNTNPYNIIFVDWQMPRMDGIELSKRIKAISDENIVIMISIANREDIEKAAKDVGIKTFLPKPIFPSMLINAVNESLGLATMTQEPEEVRQLSFDFRGKTILLAEDIPINREIVKTYLEDTGVVIEEAENGVVAVHRFSQTPGRYDAILMDIHMPDMDGYEATRKIRQMDLPQAASVPIIAMTANVFREDIDKCLAVGMNSHIGKPVKIANLREQLAVFLGTVEETAAAEPAAAPADSPEESPCIDWAEAMEMTGENEQLYRRLLGDFQGEKLYEDLLARLDGEDAEETRKAAHALKGVAASLALQRLYRTVVRIEQLAKEGKPAGHLRTELEAVYRQIMREREALLEGERSGAAPAP